MADLDLIPSLDSDADVSVSASSEDEARTVVRGQAVKASTASTRRLPQARAMPPPPPAASTSFFDDLDEARVAAAAKAAAARAAAAASKSRSSGNKATAIAGPAWSFKGAIAKIDSTEVNGSFVGTSLADKIRAVRSGGGAVGALSDDDSEAEDEEMRASSDDADDAALTAAEETDSEAPETEDEDEEEADGGVEEEGAAEEEAEEEDEEGGDAVDAILASARPNPFRQTSATSAADAPEIAKMFEPDPFNTDYVRAHPQTASAGSKRSRAAMEAAAGVAGDGSLGDAAPEASVTVEGLAAGAKLKEPTSFSDMNLSRPLLRAVAALGFKVPTPIQRRSVPLALAGHDICASAVTGSGKTAAYLLPILERLLYKPARVTAIRVLVLTPTRELATQVHSMCEQLAQFCSGIRVALIVGGMSLKTQEAELRARPDIVIATPGRLIDHIRNTAAVHCDAVDVLVLDEADRLLEMGFEDEVSQIVSACPKGRQTMLFSATMTTRVDALASLSLRKPVRVMADPLHDMAHRLSQEFVRVRPGKEGEREAMLLALATRSFTGGGCLIFAIQKHTAHRLAILLNMAGLKVAELHGNMSQRARLSALEDFRDGAVDYLVATDLAGRGLDIAGVRVVINFEMPTALTSYVHRVGRTARAGRAGVAVTLVSESQRVMMKEIVSRASLNVKSRTIAPAVITQWRERIESWEDDIAAVLASERDERTIRLAEAEATRAENLILHEDEIHARPARTWFQTETQKREVREAAAAVVNAAAAGKAGRKEAAAAEAGEDAREKRAHRMTRKKRRRMEAVADLEREERMVARAEASAARAAKAVRKAGGHADEAADEVAEIGGHNEQARAARAKVGGAASSASKLLQLDPEAAAAKRDLEQTAAITRASFAKSAKSKVRETAIRLGVTPGIAQRILQREAKGAKRGGPKRAGSGEAASRSAASSFDADMSVSAGAGAGRAGAGAGGSSGGRDKTRGDKPTKRLPGSFKSQKRFKRR